MLNRNLCRTSIASRTSNQVSVDPIAAVVSYNIPVLIDHFVLGGNKLIATDLRHRP